MLPTLSLPPRAAFCDQDFVRRVRRNAGPFARADDRKSHGEWDVAGCGPWRRLPHASGLLDSRFRPLQTDSGVALGAVLGAVLSSRPNARSAGCSVAAAKGRACRGMQQDAMMLNR